MFVCADCRPDVVDPEPVRAVCHHCGKPLCTDHTRLVRRDPAFSGVGATSAAHCDDCERQHHRGGAGR